MEALLTNASEIYAFHYFGIIILVSLLEWGVPRRVAARGLRVRWLSNFGITLIDAAVLRLLFPVAGFGWALYCAERGWGLLNQMFVPAWVAFIVTVLVLDLATFMQHYLLHRVSAPLAMHRTHHSDHDCDFSTAARFTRWRLSIRPLFCPGRLRRSACRPSPCSCPSSSRRRFRSRAHGNVRITASVERVLKLFIVTPDMHRTPSLRRCLRNELELWDIVPVVGSPVRHVCRRTGRRRRRRDIRTRRVQ